MSIHPIYRRDFLKLASIITAGLLVSRCAPFLENNQSQLEATPGIGGPSLPFFLAVTGINYLGYPENRKVEAMEELSKALNNPEQADWLLSTLSRNWRRAPRMEQIRGALARGDALGWSDCPDSRLTVPDAIPRLNLNNISPSIVAGNGTNNVNMNIDNAGNLIDYPNWDASIPIDAVVEVRQIGAQPSLFPAGINKSVFLTHESIEGCGTGCGFLGGVDQLIKYPETGTQILIDHGVPKETIGFIENWIAQNKSRFTDPMKIGPEEWAKIGAELQASINYQKYGGGDHLVLWGVRQHGTETAIPMGVVDQFGNKHEFSEVQVLKDAIDYINRPHPVFEPMVKGQQPGINIISTAAKGSSYYFGEFKQGEAFVVNNESSTITKESLETLMGGAGYSPGALKQEGNIIELVADTDVEMTRLRQTFLQTSYADDFLKSGGLIVELIPEETGLFKKTVVLRNYENPLMLLALTPEEEILAKNGVQKISGAVRVIENADDASVMTVIVRSAKDNKDYSLQIPKANGYSGITAEILESAGLPIAEASKFEQFFIKCGGIFGKTAMVAGLIWMAVDGLKYINDDLMDLGDYVQLGITSQLADIKNDNDLLSSIAKLGLEQTPAYFVYKGGTRKDIGGLLNSRVQKSIDLATLGTIKDPSFLFKLDSRQIGIPLVVPDNDTDFLTPIKISPTSWVSVENKFSEDGSPIFEVSSFNCENTSTGEKMIFEKQINGDFIKITGPDFFSFQTLVKSEVNGEIFSIPLKFHFGDENQEVIVEPDYSSTTISMTPPPKYSVPDISNYIEEYGRGFASVFRAMDVILNALS